MSRAVDLPRVRGALASLDALVRRFPKLRGPPARERLTKELDDEDEERHRGTRDGSQKETD